MAFTRRISELVGKPKSPELSSLGLPLKLHAPLLAIYDGNEEERFNAIRRLADEHLEKTPHRVALEHLASRALHEESPRLRLEAARYLADLSARKPAASETVNRLKVELKKQDSRYKDHLLEEIKALREGREPPTIERPSDLPSDAREASIRSYAREALGNPHERVRSAALERIRTALQEGSPEAERHLKQLRESLAIHAENDESAAADLRAVKRLLDPAEKPGLEEHDPLALLKKGGLLPRSQPPDQREVAYKEALAPFWRRGPQAVNAREYARVLELERELRRALVEQGKAKPRSRRKRNPAPAKERAVRAFEGSVTQKMDAIDAVPNGSREHLPALLHALSDPSDSVRRRAEKKLIDWRDGALDLVLTKAAFSAGETEHGNNIRFVQRVRRKRSKS